MTNKVYKNSTEVAQLHGVPIYMEDMLNACLVGRLNLFLQGDTGSGKTQLAADAMQHFGDKSLFVLGRNDMDTRELFQRINLEKLRTAKTSQDVREITDKVDTNLIVVDEMPNCVPAVRAQLFNLFDGYIEINGQKYPIGNGYSVGIATGNVGQKFTESTNELGRALKDRMHVILDTDYFAPQPSDTLEILAGNTNPRVEFGNSSSDGVVSIIERHRQLTAKEVPLEKTIIANYLIHGLDYCSKGSKRRMKDSWPTQLENHEQGSDVGLVLPVSVRAAKSIVRLSQSLDEIARGKGASQEVIDANAFDSMMRAYKFVAAYSGVLNEAAVDQVYAGNRYDAIDAVISTTQTQFSEKADAVRAGLEMVQSGKVNKKVLDLFGGRWEFMKSTLGGLKNDHENSHT